VTKFVVEEGKYGPWLVLEGNWSDCVRSYMIQNDVRGLILNYARGWVREDLSFLEALSFLEGFQIIERNIDDISGLHVLHRLKYLKIATYCRTAIDFSCFPELEDCFLEWRPRAKSLFSCTSLKQLYVNCYKGNSTLPLGSLVNMESLTIGNGPVKDLEGLSNLPRLNALNLRGLRKLSSLDGVEVLQTLTELRLESCRAFHTIDPVGHLHRLKEFHLINAGDIESLAPLAGLEEVEAFYLFGGTNVLDGDMSVLLTLPRLKKVALQHSRHYSHSDIEINLRLNARSGRN